MSTLCDITADLPPAANLRAVQGLKAEEAVALAEELAAYHQHFAPFFYRREQREWAAVASSADCSRLMSPARTSKPWPCAYSGWGRMRSGRCGPCNSSSGGAGGTARRSLPSLSVW